MPSWEGFTRSYPPTVTERKSSSPPWKVTFTNQVTHFTAASILLSETQRIMLPTMFLDLCFQPTITHSMQCSGIQRKVPLSGWISQAWCTPCRLFEPASTLPASLSLKVTPSSSEAFDSPFSVFDVPGEVTGFIQWKMITKRIYFCSKWFTHIYIMADK